MASIGRRSFGEGRRSVEERRIYGASPRGTRAAGAVGGELMQFYDTCGAGLTFLSRVLARSCSIAPCFEHVSCDDVIFRGVLDAGARLRLERSGLGARGGPGTAPCPGARASFAASLREENGKGRVLFAPPPKPPANRLTKPIHTRKSPPLLDRL